MYRSIKTGKIYTEKELSQGKTIGEELQIIELTKLGKSVWPLLRFLRLR